MGPCNANSVFIAPGVENKVTSLILNLKSNSPGWDSISATVIKSAERIILKPLTHLFYRLPRALFPMRCILHMLSPSLKQGVPWC